jgi:bifunctional UDP-N-acetylglucosamine pyrophosphorylase / glucosamine-1-phosphate N-acetyltransferase
MRLLIIPAAGLGTRLGAARPKPLVEVNGRTMLDHLVALYSGYVDRTVVVANPAFTADVEAWARGAAAISIAGQPSPTGMLDAILCAAPFVLKSDAREIWITWSDQIGVLPETVGRLAYTMAAPMPPALALPTVARRQPYIHFDRDASGRITGLRQRREGDAMPAEGESDMGLFAMTRETFERELADYAGDVAPGTGTGERNFLPFVPWLAARRTVATFPCTDPMEAVGINTPDDLRQVEAWLRTRP